MTAVQAYRLRALALPLGVICYFLIAILPPPPGNLELFPFFKWSLFSTTSDRLDDVVIIVRSIDGEQLDEPTHFYDLKDRFGSAEARDSRLAKTADRLAYALLNDDPVQERNTRRLIEHHYMRDARSVEYDLAMITYDPIRRYREGEVKAMLVLKRYSKS